MQNSDYGNEEDIKVMMERFERSHKPTFNDPNVPIYIKFGGRNDKDLAVGIRSGQLTVEG